MAANVDRFEKDLDRLIDQGHILQLAMWFSTGDRDETWASLKKKGITDEVLEKAVARSNSFVAGYQSWYSEALVLLKQLLPDRLADFKAQHEIPRGRKDEVTVITYVMSDYLLGLRTSRDGKTLADQSSALGKFQNQLSIVLAARQRFKSSLFEIRQLVQADLFDSEIESARELLKNKFLRAAGAIAGVVLEKHLRQVCDDHGVPIKKKNPGIADLNDALKNALVIDVPQWRHVTLMGDYRNLCDHNKQKEPTAEQVSDLIDGTDKILKTIA